MPNRESNSLHDAQLRALAARHGTPLYVYDGATIEQRVRDLAGFDVVRFAQKANSNLAVLALLKRLGCQVDAVSAGEIERALRAGFAPHEIVFTADLFDRAALDAVARLPVEVNCGSPFMLEQLARVRPRASVTLRVNPGFGHGHDRKVNTGGETSKHGIWHTELPAAVARARELGLVVRGIHVHIGSGADLENLERVRGALAELAPLAGPDLALLSVGGGLPIPYREDEERIDVARFTLAWRATQRALEQRLGRSLVLEVEPGRFLVAESGVLLTEVRGEKRTGAVRYVLVDAGFHNLVRPAMYGAYHRITALTHAGVGPATPAVVAGPLCESADVFTQTKDGELDPQLLPPLSEGDLLCVHAAGAYGMSMASNYNSQPLAAEVLVDRGEARLVRRRQTLDELLSSESA
ncbi:MAG: diaminopimelate decarboxylase [Planctomycetes bacterium]|nr:diaminopimelate decarboxylase [Planctomycetota bacterium]